MSLGDPDLSWSPSSVTQSSQNGGPLFWEMASLRKGARMPALHRGREGQGQRRLHSVWPCRLWSAGSGGPCEPVFCRVIHNQVGLGQSPGDRCFSRAVSMLTSPPSFPLALSLENSASFLDPKPWPPLRKSLPSGPLDLQTTMAVKAVSWSRPYNSGHLCPSDNGHGEKSGKNLSWKNLHLQSSKGSGRIKESQAKCVDSHPPTHACTHAGTGCAHTRAAHEPWKSRRARRPTTLSAGGAPQRPSCPSSGQAVGTPKHPQNLP